MSRHVLLVCEGPQDEAFIAKLLRVAHHFHAQTRKSRLDAFWERTVPKDFPHNDDLRMRVPVPAFYENPHASVAILVAGGDSKIATGTVDTLAVLPSSIDALGIVLDADSAVAPSSRFEVLGHMLQQQGLSPPSQLGVIDTGPPMFGVYVLPDNTQQGTLEDLLLDCAQVAYPKALVAAQQFASSVPSMGLSSHDLGEYERPAGPKKVTVGAVANVLRPGKAIQNTITHDQWLSAATAELPRVVPFRVFLETLIGNTAPAPSPAQASSTTVHTP